jgi:hypothetical protein
LDTFKKTPHPIYNRYGPTTTAAMAIGATALTIFGDVRPKAAFGVVVMEGFDPPVVVAATFGVVVADAGPLPETAVIDALRNKLVAKGIMSKINSTYLEEPVAVPEDSVAVTDELPELVAVEEELLVADPELELDEEEKAGIYQHLYGH